MYTHTLQTCPTFTYLTHPERRSLFIVCVCWKGGLKKKGEKKIVVGKMSHHIIGMRCQKGHSFSAGLNTDTTQTQPHQISNTQRTENKTIDVVIQQHSRKLLMMDILMSDTCWAPKKWSKIISDIKLVFYSSTDVNVLDCNLGLTLRSGVYGSALSQSDVLGLDLRFTLRQAHLSCWTLAVIVYEFYKQKKIQRPLFCQNFTKSNPFVWQVIKMKFVMFLDILKLNITYAGLVRDRVRSVITVIRLRTGIYESSEFDFRQEQEITSTLFWWTFRLVEAAGFLPGFEADHCHLSVPELRKSELSLQFSKHCPDLVFASSRGQTYLYIYCRMGLESIYVRLIMCALRVGPTWRKERPSLPPLYSLVKRCTP